MSNTRSKRSDSINESMMGEFKGIIEIGKAEIISSLSSEISQLRESVKTLSKRVEDLETTNATLRAKCKELSDVSLDKVLEECDQRKRRENNIVVSGVKEKLDGSVDARKYSDNEEVEKLLKHMVVWSDVYVNEVRRLGRPNSGKGPRLLLVRLGCFDEKLTFV